MKVHFLGGTDEVGASCLLVEIGGHRILMDCGIRMKSRDGDKLPYLDRIREEGGVEAVILTHGHTDHSGGLPVFYLSYPGSPLYLTPPSLSLIQVLLMDALKIMEGELEREGEIPLYPPAAVETVLAAARPIPFFQKFELFEGDVHFTFYPAGHILGAASVVLEGKKDGTLMVTGDISMTDQITVPGAVIPPVRPDLIITESTYGGRLHANRAGEERRLIDQTAKILDQEGAILFPTFAIGRAQEVILILSRAMEKGDLKRVPLMVDGMVRKVCSIYSSFPQYLTPWLRRRTKKHGNPFFYEGSPASPVENPRHRFDYAKMRPALFVASSGMLTGGPSQFYARELVQDPLSFISITGYQDEESPGRHLQNLAQEGKGELKLGGETFALQCGIGTYSLSAHGDTSELVSLLTALSPEEIALVHGDEDARAMIERVLHQSGMEKVHLLKLGDTLEVAPRKGRSSSSRSPRKPLVKGISSPALQQEDLLDLATSLLAQNRPNQLYSIQEILLSWGDFEGAQSPEEISRVEELLGSSESPFEAHQKKAFLYQIRTDEKGEILCGTPWPLDQTSALNKVDEIFPEEAGLYKRSALIGPGEIILSFHFPKVAQVQFKEAIEQLKEETGWEVRVRPEPHGEVMDEAARQAIPPDWPLRKNPVLYLIEEKVVLFVDLPDEELEGATIDREEFQKKTGFELVIEGNSPKKKTKPSIIAGRMEINTAYRTLRGAFEGRAHQPLKTSLKEGRYIEVAFISPQVGERYRKVLDELEEETHWPLEIRKSPDQHRIKQIAKKLASPLGTMRKEPTFLEGEQRVIYYLSSLSGEEEKKNEILSQFKEETGYELVLEGGSN